MDARSRGETKQQRLRRGGGNWRHRPNPGGQKNPNKSDLGFFTSLSELKRDNLHKTRRHYPPRHRRQQQYYQQNGRNLTTNESQQHPYWCLIPYQYCPVTGPAPRYQDYNPSYARYTRCPSPYHPLLQASPSVVRRSFGTEINPLLVSPITDSLLLDAPETKLQDEGVHNGLDFYGTNADIDFLRDGDDMTDETNDNSAGGNSAHYHHHTGDFEYAELPQAARLRLAQQDAIIAELEHENLTLRERVGLLKQEVATLKVGGGLRPAEEVEAEAEIEATAQVYDINPAQAQSTVG